MTIANARIVVGLAGGLGNQMFQYAAGRALSLRLNVPLLVDVSWFTGRRDRTYALGPFCIAAVPVIGSWPLPPRLRRLESRISRRLSHRRMGLPILRERHFHYDEAFDRVFRSAYLEGFWQSERYFAPYRRFIADDFRLRDPLPGRCLSVLEQIGKTNAICVHVRRGDFASDPDTARAHGTCTPEYYRTAVAAAATALDRPRCFVFSDEPEWASANLSLPVPSTIVAINGAHEAHWDLALMAACRHFVIANSSLSWWGAWLGKQTDKRVFAPARWFRSKEQNTADLLPVGWHRVAQS